MSNQSLINSNLTSSLEPPSLDQLLDSLGFDLWKTILATFIIPATSFIGIIFCSLSAWIFFQKNFKDPVFFYYRLLCIVYIIHLIHNIPYGLLFSPRYIPQMNTYLSSFYLIYFTNVSALLFHFEETIQMAILLTRMKIFSPFVERHFKARPWVISLSFFLTCLFINSFSALGLKIDSLGTYSYIDSSNSIKHTSTFFYFNASDFVLTLWGQIISGFTGIILNLLLSIIIGVILNIFSVHLYRSYVRERREKDKEYTRVKYHTNKDQNQSTTSLDEIQVVVVSKVNKLTQKEINENKSEKNMFFMALTLCSISILSRVLIIFSYVLFIFFNTFSNSLSVYIINIGLYSFAPSVAIFVFYFFNKMFREEFREKFFKKGKKEMQQK